MKKINIKPFDEFWLNCIFNNSFSILTSLNDKYKDLAYLNCYTYSAYNSWAPKHINLHIDGELQEEIMNSTINNEYFCINCEDDYMHKIVNLLNKNNILIRVELYDWLPNSASWHKVHHYHYSLVTGYDSSKKNFTVIDDDNIGYGIKYVPYERFSKCVIDESSNITGHIIKEKKGKIYDLCLKDIILFAKEINKNISCVLENNDLWIESMSSKGEKLYEFYAFEIYKIENRHIANTYLMRRMWEKNFINKVQYERYKAYFEDIKEGWKKIKYILLKLNYQSENSSEYGYIKKINLLKDNLLNKEYQIWKEIINIE